MAMKRCLILFTFASQLIHLLSFLCGVAMPVLMFTPHASGESSSGAAAAGKPLHTREGSDPTFAELVERGIIKPGESFSKGPVTGSRIHVDHGLLEKQVGKMGPIPKDIGLHTEVCGDRISRKNFDQWTRWYQEDGNVQVFRLFKGEQNVRGGIGEQGSPGRIEAYTKSLTVEPGSWREWEGTFTMVDPVGACVFQLFHAGGTLWPMHIDMTDKGEIHFLRRRPGEEGERQISMGKDMTGKSIRVKVRANGVDFEVYQKNPLEEEPWKLVAKGTGPKAEDNKIQFRWGMYCGSKKGHTVPKDALLFVTGVVIR